MKMVRKLRQWIINRYEVAYELIRVVKLRITFHLQIMHMEETIRYIKRHKCSISRFGDGEFNIILGVRGISFQDPNMALGKRLVDTLHIRDNRVLLCVPGAMNSTRKCNHKARVFWKEWGRQNNKHIKIVSLLRDAAGTNYRFGDAQITRPYIDWIKSARPKRVFSQIKGLWDDKHILIVEGTETRSGVANDLYSGAASVKRILAPSRNAFDYYDSIKDCILKHYQDELVLIALGPTATVLAADLAMMDIQALDIGHIDIEYEWFLREAEHKIVIPGKYTGEVESGNNVVACTDEIYLQQIIDRIGS